VRRATAVEIVVVVRAVDLNVIQSSALAGEAEIAPRTSLVTQGSAGRSSGSRARDAEILDLVRIHARRYGGPCGFDRRDRFLYGDLFGLCRDRQLEIDGESLADAHPYAGDLRSAKPLADPTTW